MIYMDLSSTSSTHLTLIQSNLVIQTLCKSLRKNAKLFSFPYINSFLCMQYFIYITIAFAYFVHVLYYDVVNLEVVSVNAE